MTPGVVVGNPTSDAGVGNQEIVVEQPHEEDHTPEVTDPIDDEDTDVVVHLPDSSREDHGWKSVRAALASRSLLGTSAGSPGLATSSGIMRRTRRSLGRGVSFSLQESGEDQHGGLVEGAAPDETFEEELNISPSQLLKLPAHQQEVLLKRATLARIRAKERRETRQWKALKKAVQRGKLADAGLELAMDLSEGVSSGESAQIWELKEKKSFVLLQDVDMMPEWFATDKDKSAEEELKVTIPCGARGTFKGFLQQEIQSAAEKRRVRERLIKRNMAEVEADITSVREKGDENPVGRNLAQVVEVRA